MLIGPVLAVPVFELAPQPVQMDRVFHHRVVDQHKAHPLAALEHNGPGFRELLAVEAPHEALHIAGQVQRDLARGRARIIAGPCCAQIGVAEHAPARGEAFAGFVQALGRHHRDVIDADAALELFRLGRCAGHS